MGARNNPRALANLKPFTAEDAAKARAAKAEKARLRAENPDAFPPKQPAYVKRVGLPKLKTQELDAIYADQVFPGDWRFVYKHTLNKLKQQYSLGQNTIQYKIMTQRTATLHVKVMMLEAKANRDEKDDYLLLRMDKQLQDYIQALQKYTEAERREINVTNTLVVTTLTKVVAIAEATVTDAQMRLAFMRGLASLISDSPLALPAAEHGVPAPEDVIEGEVVESSSDV